MNTEFGLYQILPNIDPELAKNLSFCIKNSYFSDLNYEFLKSLHTNCKVFQWKYRL